MDRSPSPPRRTSAWLVSRRYDGLLFIGSALLPLPMVGLYRALQGRLLPLGGDGQIATYFIFAALFDHPHIFQSFSRTLVDPVERARHRTLHTWGLLVFIAAGFAIQAAGLERMFIGVTAFYGTWHIMRQRWGFLRLYKGLAQDWAPLETRLDTTLFYLGMGATWMVGYSDVSDRVVVYHQLTAPFPRVPVWLAKPVFMLFVGVLVLYCLRQLYRALRGRHINVPKLLLLGSALSTHAYIYLLADLPFLVTEAVQTIYHDMQYRGFIAHYQRRRFGPQMVWRFFAYAAIYGLVAASLECTALLQRQLVWISIPGGMIVIYHYYADGKIWRFREAPELSVLMPSRGDKEDGERDAAGETEHP